MRTGEIVAVMTLLGAGVVGYLWYTKQLDWLIPSGKGNGNGKKDEDKEEDDIVEEIEKSAPKAKQAEKKKDDDELVWTEPFKRGGEIIERAKKRIQQEEEESKDTLDELIRLALRTPPKDYRKVGSVYRPYADT